MKNSRLKNGFGVLSVLIVLVLVLVQASPVFADSDVRGGPGGQGGGGRGGGNGGNGSGTGNPGLSDTSPLSADEVKALQEAVLEEYGALNLYQAVIDQFGSVAPFVQIAKSEQQHVNMLISQAEKRGVEVPANPGLTTAVSFDSLTDACAAGVAAEIADAALYDELMPVTTHADLLQVYQNLQSASLENHLPAFEACD